MLTFMSQIDGGKAFDGTEQKPSREMRDQYLLGGSRACTIEQSTE